MRRIETAHGAVTIRTTVEADLDAVRELRVEALKNHPESFGTTPGEVHVHNFDCTDDRATFVADAGGRLVGLTGVYRGPLVKERHRSGLWSVYVCDDFRGNKLADALIEAAIDWSAERGVKIVSLMVTTTNTPAIACYHRLGFRISGVEHATMCVDGKMLDEFHMYRWLQ